MSRLKGVPYISIIFATVNVVAFAFCAFTGDMMYNKFGLDPVCVVRGGEYYRLITSMFLHGGIDHLFNNMIILFFMGVMLENYLGHLTYFLLAMGSGLAGNIASLAVKISWGETVMSIGASGIVFGLDGVLLAITLFAVRKPEHLTLGRVLIMILLSLYSGFSGSNIDNAAHVGGLMTGFVLGCVTCLFGINKANIEGRTDERY
ncbi:MAG: rhomboid family intramembrane serine protease [Acetatifactor sp.]|nr:rhomboid family intramembrane serine protease [Acetatifactor sp.]